jgi:hypothetical protein
MLESKAVVDVLVVALLAIGGYLLFLMKEGGLAVVKTTLEETAKARVAQMEFQEKLAQELQRTRGVERQELRYKSYGALWEKLRPLAIYDETVINRETVRELSTKLSDWYFSPTGGLLLTPQARYFYFALQDLLRNASNVPEAWEADRVGASESQQRSVFEEVLRRTNAAGAISVLNYFKEGVFDNWQRDAGDLSTEWKAGTSQVAAAWKELDPKQRFATLQQAGSILRSSLAVDLESRAQ